MKKLVATLLIILLFLSFGTVFAVEERNIMETNTASQIIEESEKVNDEMDEYTRKYGSPEYGTTAFILNKVRLYSIPLCFIGIVMGALYQYVLGTRRLDMKHKGFGIIIASVTILVICQVLPLIFAIVVRGWR
ncbi:MAG: hypothetical protein U0M00_00970 [Clostridia bacterium]|jgi:hypothetical protein|nr:hypothetical protein [Clostridia bacterium]